ncbi:AraC family transcriptional regulator [Myxacorys almedinensis]|uniref:Helix-turn-helix domain-containing protein n=1 Tax=Myxacorys almedinensis A TaxID=2690445 RepID=A0A8J7Z0C7_9CYAN|nr:AraC family transcriptional regulator [Myxacorys almedinensis]NDJ17922.1 helix-turn-helix domain-containing protein [Myxacorys almedinensis A]
MTIALSQDDYWALFCETQPSHPEPNSFETVLHFPEALGNGFTREIDLRHGLELAIADYHLHQPLSVKTQERPHPLQYCFVLTGGFKNPSYGITTGQYSLCGSGLAPAETVESTALHQQEVNVHIEPDLFLTFWNSTLETLQPELKPLIPASLEPYYCGSGTTTMEMQTTLQQLLRCPFQGITRRIYLESKVWELMALLMAQELERCQVKPALYPLKPEDVDRIHYAREILLHRLDNPPSLSELARQVGLNECTLKRGFRVCFGKTAFGYLHDYRLEQARRLLEERRLNVSEVARAIGFVNRSYFAAAFQKKFGVTPKIYQARHRNSV